MNPKPQSDTKAAAPAKTRSNNFFRKRAAPLAREDARRQGNISQLAWLTLGGTGTESARDTAIAFLNTEHPELGGRPLAIATASDEGYARVATAIRAHAAAPVTP
ncbi:DUF2384 domain-containing protein [Sphingopyxis witflariensis]|uniref:Antitoxin Xre/MbcA/ParS-like toxin-binding domain-containing protein n=1 Tax=Sphingopyxis witflariensis TaxID=173675 RepID=A0A246JGP2_9SPHN|nr:DUF2384 domain-containing protein [Sphingopyxis witflariensis]OWQ91769.1 hypothetical protein CDQ91_18740 [Sphingopyxis witflariensis]